MSPFVLAVLKYAFLALLYFFVFRALRAVAVQIRPKGQDSATRPIRVAAKPPRGRGKGKLPTTLVVKGEDGKKLGSYPLRSTVQLGRAEACHVRLEDRYASQFHARLYQRDGSWYVEDLGSTNGTYLNRQRVQGAMAVQAGDQIKIGRTTMELRK